MNKKGFTLVELLAVIVVLAIILAIAVPGITGIVRNASISSFESDAKLVLKAIDYQKLKNESFDVTSIDKDTAVSLLGLSNDNYQSLKVVIEDNINIITIVGQNKWAGFIACGSYRNIKVVENINDCSNDLVPPVITVLGDNPVSINVGDTYSDAGATASDNKDGDITSNITISGTINPSVPGSYTITYRVTDSAGNTTTETRTVNVIAVLATVITNSPAINITTTGATVSGEVMNDGGSAITERGIVYGTSANPTISGAKVTSAGTTGTFSVNIMGLTKATTYYARSYALNITGISYGDEISFSTLQGGIDQYTKLILHMDGIDNGTTFTDEVGKVITRYGDTVIKTVIKKVGTSSAYFDGVGDYLTTADSDDWYFSTGDFTVEAYIYLINDNLYMYDIISQYRYNSGYDDAAWSFDYYPTNEGLRFTWQGGSIATSQPYSITKNVWHHVAAVRQGNKMMLFYDGNKVKEQDCTGLNIGNSSRTLNIGYMYANGNYYWNGYLDEIRVSKGIARWTSNFTPPLSPYTAE